MRRLLVVALFGLTACAAKTTPALNAAAAACPVSVAIRAGEPWRQVTADGFTFCVPESWRPSGENTLRGAGGWIRWGVGEPQPTVAHAVAVTVPARQGPLVPPGRQHRFSEMIGGGLAELWDNELQGVLYTGAQWRQPKAIYLLGQSTSQAARTTQQQVYRTVRFATE